MNESSKCGRCVRKEECEIRSAINAIIKEAIKNAENEIRNLAPKQTDYLIVTDMAVIPINCREFEGPVSVRDVVLKKVNNSLNLDNVAPSAV